MPAEVRTLAAVLPTRPLLGVVVSRYNQWITDRLLEGALEAIARHTPDAEITVVPVPGAWELVGGAGMCVEAGVDAIVCLGCVIKGETEHDRYINDAVSRALVEMSSEVPVGFGLLTVHDAAQGEARAGGALGNKGAEAAEAALTMLGLWDAMLVGTDA